MSLKTNVIGYPRIGADRELKKALEAYWSGKIGLDELQKTSSALRAEHWTCQKEAGIDLISCNDFSWYDNMLDTAVMLNAVPSRFRKIKDKTGRYFAMARGTEDSAAMEMTKWFNTNYHYIMPELSDSDSYRLDSSKIVKEYNEARALGINPKINIIGPLTFLALSKRVDSDGDCLDLFPRILPLYKELVEQLAGLNAEVIVQFDEPYFIKGASKRELELLRKAYNTLGLAASNIKIIVATYFEHSNEATAVLTETPIWALALDFVHGKRNMKGIVELKGKKLIAGVINGRNIWANDIVKTVGLLNEIAGPVDRDDIIISTSCSLLHVPYTLESEERLDDELKSWLSFAGEKLAELSLAARLFFKESLNSKEKALLEKNRAAIKTRAQSSRIHNNAVAARVNALTCRERAGSFEERITAQRDLLAYPDLVTTTIGSFPQTKELRKLRADYKKGNLSPADYEAGIKSYINDCIAFQEEAGIDILVHGEPERNDMVEYFGELLEGFLFTKKGWVQSYGSRCVKPPVIYGDVSRARPMTLKWLTYAQEQTKRPLKGMLTGAVTILNWSFVRDDLERSAVSEQIALALSDEIGDLQDAGIKIIQVDEAAFKEGYPLRTEDIPHYESWAVDSFKLAVSKAVKDTQIHTHMCYSEFNDIIKTIEKMDADVISIETARSGNELLKIFKEAGYRQEVGPGVYDIHSPRVPSTEEIVEQIKALLEVLPERQLWINPDCGLKTRQWAEVKPALTNMVKAVKLVRASRVPV